MVVRLITALLLIFIITLSLPSAGIAGQNGDASNVDSLSDTCGDQYLTPHLQAVESFESRVDSQLKKVRKFAKDQGLPAFSSSSFDIEDLFRNEFLSVESRGVPIKEKARKLAQELLRIANAEEAKKAFRQMVQGYQDTATVRQVLARADKNKALEFIARMSSDNFRGLPADFETNKEFLKELVANYPQLDLLSNEASPETAGDGTPPANSPSIILGRGFNKGFDIAVRSILNFFLVRKGVSQEDQSAYQAFANESAQPAGQRLSLASFSDMHLRFKRLFPGVQEIHAQIVSLSMNDIGKSKVLARALGMFDLIADHDNVLDTALESDLLKDFKDLDKKFQKLIRGGIKAKVNIAQMRQGENNVASIEGGFGMGVKELEWFHANDVLHVGAFLAARNPKGAATWIEPLHQRDARMLAQLKLLAKRHQNPKETYERFLAGEAQLLGLPNVFDDPASMAATRIALMMRSYSAEEAHAIYEKLKSRTEGPSIVRSLNSTGQTGGALIYYAPAFWQKFRGLKNDDGVVMTFAEALDVAFPIYRRILLEAQYYGLAEGVTRYIVVNIGRFMSFTVQQLRDNIIEIIPTGDGGAEAVLVPIAETPENDRFLLSPLQIQQFARISRSWALQTVAAQDESFLRNSGLTQDELVAIWAYQNTLIARELCWRMRAPGGLDHPQFKQLADLIDSALNKLERTAPSLGYPGPFKGTVFRLVRYPQSLIDEYYQVYKNHGVISLGGNPPKDAVVSAAQNPGNPERWLNGVNLKIFIHAQIVAPIFTLGTMADKKRQDAAEFIFDEDADYNRAMLREVLFRTGTYFRIPKMEKNANDVWEMTVEQVIGPT